MVRALRALLLLCLVAGEGRAEVGFFVIGDGDAVGYSSKELDNQSSFRVPAWPVNGVTSKVFRNLLSATDPKWITVADWPCIDSPVHCTPAGGACEGSGRTAANHPGGGCICHCGSVNDTATADHEKASPWPSFAKKWATDRAERMYLATVGVNESSLVTRSADDYANEPQWDPDGLGSCNDYKVYDDLTANVAGGALCLAIRGARAAHIFSAPAKAVLVQLGEEDRASTLTEAQLKALYKKQLKRLADRIWRELQLPIVVAHAPSLRSSTGDNCLAIPFGDAVEIRAAISEAASEHPSIFLGPDPSALAQEDAYDGGGSDCDHIGDVDTYGEAWVTAITAAEAAGLDAPAMTEPNYPQMMVRVDESLISEFPPCNAGTNGQYRVATNALNASNCTSVGSVRNTCTCNGTSWVDDTTRYYEQASAASEIVSITATATGGDPAAREYELWVMDPIVPLMDATVTVEDADAGDGCSTLPRLNGQTTLSNVSGNPRESAQEWALTFNSPSIYSACGAGTWDFRIRVNCITPATCTSDLADLIIPVTVTLQ